MNGRDTDLRPFLYPPLGFQSIPADGHENRYPKKVSRLSACFSGALDRSWSVLIFLIIGMPVCATANEAVIDWVPAPRTQSADGDHSVKLRGRVHWDAAWIDDDSDTTDIDETEFRAARIGIEGTTFGRLRYRLEFDFAGGETSVKDTWLATDVGRIELKAGHIKLAPSLEEATSSQYITFMERASFTDAFGFARQFGVAAKTAGANWQAQIGAFRNAATDDGKDAGTMLVARASYGPKIDRWQLHVGAAIRYRNRDADHADLGYSQRPHQHLSPKFINTGRIADADLYYGLEAATIRGPLSVQAEWAWLESRLSDSFLARNKGQSDPTFTGGYISASYFLTGELRPYRPANGGFGRIRVDNPLHNGGLGAWELGARFDRLDLSDNRIAGGEQNLWIIGLNWYPNRYMRVMFNYSRAKIENAFLVPELNGADGKNAVDAIGLRAQINW